VQHLHHGGIRFVQYQQPHRYDHLRSRHRDVRQRQRLARSGGENHLGSGGVERSGHDRRQQLSELRVGRSRRGGGAENAGSYRSGSSLTDLTIRNNASGKTLTISNELANAWQGVASVTFADGTVWHASDIAANTYITAASGSYNTSSLSGTIIYDLGTGTFGN